MKDTKLSTKTRAVLIDVILPSAIGLVVYFTVFLITVIDNQLESYRNAIFNLHLADFQGTFVYHPLSAVNSFIKLPIVSGVSVYVFWIIIGLMVYLVANAIVSDSREVVEDIGYRHYIWPQNSDKNKPLKQFIEKLLLHLALVIVIIIYVLKLLPFLQHWWGTNQVKLSLTSHSIMINLYLLIFEVLFLHGLVVLLRLLFNRRRLIN